MISMPLVVPGTASAGSRRAIALPAGRVAQTMPCAIHLDVERREDAHPAPTAPTGVPGGSGSGNST